MRILILSHMYPRTSYPAGGIFVHEQAKALMRHGAEVAVLSGDPYWVHAVDPLRVARSLKAYRDTVPAWNTWDDVPVMHFPYCVGGVFRNAVPALTYLHGARRVAESVLISFPFDVIHAHTSFLDGYAGARLAASSGRPLVITEHMGPFSLLTRNLLFRHFVRSALNNANRVLAVSNTLRRDMIDEVGRCADKVEILGNGFDPDIFSPAPANRGKRAVRALWIGQISPVKGVDRLIRSLARMADRQPPLSLTLLGAVDGTPETLALATQLGVRDRICIQSPQDRAGVAAAIRAHDFVVVSSHKETFSLAALESLACGRPVLTTACGGPEDFVVNGENGLVVPNSEDGLAQGLATMALTHKSFNARGIGQAARNHTWDAVSEKLLGVYKQVLEEGVSARVAASAAARPARQAGSPS